MKSKLSLLALAFLTACGGGGGSSTPSTPVTPVTPAPTVQITLSAPKIFIGDTAKISWTSSNATTCTGVDGFAGIQPISGTINFTPTVGGQFKYSLRCTGAGGSSDAIQTVIVPIPPQRTSYLNFKNNGIGQIKLPEYTHAMTYGDFFQDGTISLMTSPVIADVTKPSDVNKVGKVKFYKNVNGAWVNHTKDIVPDDSGCVWPRKAVSADFNGDRKPDIFLSCHGFDVAPWAGEKQIMFLSQVDGTYKRSVIDIINCFAHGATAADFIGDGYADLVTTCSNNTGVTYFKNNKNGTFTEATDKISSITQPILNNNNLIGRAIHSVEFLDINSDGNLDLFIGGSDYYESKSENEGSLSAWTPKVFLNRNGKFNQDYINLPIDKLFDVTLDILLDGNAIVVMKTNYVNNQFKIVRADLTGTLMTESYLPNNGIFWIIKDSIKGIVTASN